GLFVSGSIPLAIGAASGQTIDIADQIAGGAAGLVLDGPGTVRFDGPDGYGGLTTIASGTLVLTQTALGAAGGITDDSALVLSEGDTTAVSAVEAPYVGETFYSPNGGSSSTQFTIGGGASFDDVVNAFRSGFLFSSSSVSGGQLIGIGESAQTLIVDLPNIFLSGSLQPYLSDPSVQAFEQSYYAVETVNATFGGLTFDGLGSPTLAISIARPLAPTDQVSINGVTVTVGGVGQLSDLVAAIGAAHIAGVTASIDQTSGRLRLSSANGPLVLADVTGTPWQEIGVTPGTYPGTALAETLAGPLTGTGTVLVNFAPGSDITLAGVASLTGAVTIAAGNTLTLAASGSSLGQVIDDGALAFSQTGTASVGGAITGGGAVSVSGGTVTLSGAGDALGAAVVANGVLTISGPQDVVSGPVTLTNASLSLTNAGDQIGGSVTLTRGALALQGTGDSVLGAVTINAGALTVSGAGESIGGALTLNGSTATFAGAVGGGIVLNGGSLSLTGSTSLISGGIAVNGGALTITGAVDLQGGVAIDGGTVSLQAANAIGANGVTFAAKATDTLVIGSGDVPTGVIYGLNPGVTIDLEGIGAVTDTPTIAANGLLTVVGANRTVTLQLDPSQSYAGGGLQINAHGDGAGGADVQFQPTSYSLGAGPDGLQATIQQISVGGALAAPNTNYSVGLNSVGTATPVNLAQNSTLNLSGVLDQALEAQQLPPAGVASLTLQQGLTTLNNFVYDPFGTFGASQGIAISVGSGASLAVGMAQFNDVGAVAIALHGDQTLLFAPGAGQETDIGGSITDDAGSGAGSGVGRLVIQGAGKTVLDAGDSFTGGITVDSGSLDLNAPGAGGSGGVTLDGGDLTFSTPDAISSSPIVFGGPGATLSLIGNFPLGLANTIEGFGAGDQIILNDAYAPAPIVEAGNIVLVGLAEFHFDPSQDLSAGVFYVTPTQYYVGGQAQPGQSLQFEQLDYNVASPAALANAITGVDASPLMAGRDGRAITLTQGLTAAGPLTSALPAIDLPAGASLTIDGEGQTLDGGGETGFVLSGGPLTLENLSLSGFGSAGAVGGALWIGAGDTVTLAGGSVTGGAGAPGTLGSGVSIAAGGTLIIVPSAASPVVIGDAIAGAGAVEVAGPGIVSFTAANSFTGGLALSAGQLVLAAAGAGGSGPITVSGGVLEVSAAAAAGISAIILSGDGQLVLDAGAAIPTVDGFSGQGTIDLLGDPLSALTLAASTGGVVVDGVTLAGVGAVEAQSDGQGGTRIIIPAPVTVQDSQGLEQALAQIATYAGQAAFAAADQINLSNAATFDLGGAIDLATSGSLTISGGAGASLIDSGISGGVLALGQGALTINQVGLNGFLPVPAAGSGASVTLNHVTVTLTMAQLAAAIGDLSSVSGTYNFAISDNWADIEANTALLGELGPRLAKITLTDPAGAPISITEAQYRQLSPYFAGSYNVNLTNVAAADAASFVGKVSTVSVTDTASNISANINALSNGFSSGQLKSVTVSDSSTLTVDQWLVFDEDYDGPSASVLSTISNADGSALTLHVMISAIWTASTPLLTVLSNDARVTSISFYDSGTPVIPFYSAANARAYSLITGPYQLNVVSTDVADALALASNPHVTPFEIEDTPANIAGALVALNGEVLLGKITRIDPDSYLTPISDLSAAAVVGAPAAIDALTYQASVQDTAANISANLDGLEGVSNLLGILVTDNANVTVSIGQLQTDAGALSKLIFADEAEFVPNPEFPFIGVGQEFSTAGVGVGYSLTVADTVANVTADLAALGANPKVTAITLTNGPFQALVLSEIQVNQYSAAIAKLTGAGYLEITGAHAADAAGLALLPLVSGIAVFDTGADISASLDSLNGNPLVSQIVVSDGAPITVDMSQLIHDRYALGLLRTPAGAAVSVTVADKAQFVAQAFDQLNGNPLVGSIVLTDGGAPTLTLTDQQLHADTRALGVIAGPYQLAITGVPTADLAAVTANAHVTSIQITDTAANIAAAFPAIVGAGDVVAITVADGQPVTISVAQHQADGATLAALSNPGGTPAGLEILDSSTSIAVGLDALAADSRVALIVTTDSGAVTVSVAQLTRDAAAIAVLQTGQATPASLQVTDTAAHVQAALDSLSANGRITAVTLTDTGTPTLDVTQTQLTADSSILGLIGSSYQLEVSGVPVADLAAVAGASHVTGVEIFDSAANLAADLGALSIDSTVVGLTASDSAPLTLTVAQLTSDTAALAELTNASGSAYQVAIVDLGASIDADLPALIANPHIASISATDGLPNTLDVAELGTVIDNPDGTPAPVNVVDSAANMSGVAFDAIQAKANVVSISFTDLTTPVLSLAVGQLTSDSQALGLIVGAYDLAVSGVSVAALAGVEATSHLTSVSIVDTAAKIQADLANLAADPRISQVVISDNLPLTLDAAQLTADAAAIGKLVFASGGNSGVVQVVDTAANLDGVLGALIGDGEFGKVTISDNQPLVMSTAQYLSAYSGISGGEFVNADGSSFQINIEDTVAGADQANGSSLQQSHLASFTITDTADNILSFSQGSDHSALNAFARFDIVDNAIDVLRDLQKLGDLGAAINSIKFTDPGTPTLIISGDLYQVEAAILKRLSISAYDLEVYNVVAADVATPGGAMIAADGRVVSIQVADTAANIASNFDQLNAASQLAPITVTSGGPVTLDVAPALADTAAESLLPAGDLAVSDSSANVTAGLARLSLNLAISTITLDDTGPVTLDVAQLTADGALSRLQGFNGLAYTLSVIDTAANIGAGFDALNADSHVTSISFTDGGTPTLTLGAAQYLTDTGALGAVTEAHDLAITGVAVSQIATFTPIAGVTSIAVADTAANVAADLDNLNSLADLASITLTDAGTQNLVVTRAQLTSDRGALGLIQGTHFLTVTGVAVADIATVAALPGVGSIQVLDTAANISADLDTLNGDSTVTAISVADSLPITLSIAQLASDTRAPGLLSHADNSPYTLAIRDTAANISADLDNLDANPHVSAIIAYDEPPLDVSVSQLTNNAILKAAGGLTVVDTAARVFADLVAIADNSAIRGITLTDTTVPTVPVSATQFAANDLAYFETAQLISEAYNLDLTGVTFVQLEEALQSGEALQSHVTSFTVTDTSANIFRQLDYLEGLAGLQGVTLTDSTTPTLPLTQGQLTSDARVLGLISGAFNLAITGATVSTALTYGDDPQVTSLAVSDSAAAISASLDQLNAASQITSISVNAGGAVSLSLAQMRAYTHALAELGTGSLSVVDTAANISANLNALASDSQVASIVITDVANLDLDVAQFTADSALLRRIHYADGGPVYVEVIDTAANVSAALNQLASDRSVDFIELSDEQPVAVTYVQFAAGDFDKVELAGLSEPFTVPPTMSVTGSAAQIIGGYTDLEDSLQVAVITVSDTAANITANLPALAALPAYLPILTSPPLIVVSDDKAVVMNVAQLGADTAFLARFSNADGSAYTLQIADTAADVTAGLAAITANGHVKSIVLTDNAPLVLTAAQAANAGLALPSITNPNGAPAIKVLDSAADVGAVLGALGAVSGLSLITLTDATTPTITLTQAQFIQDSPALNLIATASPYDLVITNAAAGAVTSLEADPHVTSIGVSDNLNDTLPLLAALTADPKVGGIQIADTSTSIVAALTTPNSPLVASTKVTQLTFTDPQHTPQIRISSATLFAEAGTLNLISGSYSIDLIDVPIEDFPAANAVARVVRIEQVTAAIADYLANPAAVKAVGTGKSNGAAIVVQDSAANVSAYLSSPGYKQWFSYIALTDPEDYPAHPIPVLSATYDAYIKDLNLFNQLEVDSRHLARVTGVSVANISEVVGSYYGLQVSVSDTAANLAGSTLDSLAADFGTNTQLMYNTEVVSVVVSDNGASAGGFLPVSVAQLSSDATLLASLSFANGATAGTLEVADTAANITADFDNLNADPQIGAIEITDNGPIILTATQLANDGVAIGELRNANGRPVQVNQFHWVQATSGAFALAADWTSNQAPGAADAAILDAPGSSAYVVTASTSQTVASIQTAATATLSITGGVFNAAGGTGAGANAGIISAVNGSTLQLGDSGADTITNTGLILAGLHGAVTITGAVANSGHLAVDGGALTVVGAVSGPGYGEVIAGTLDFTGAFNESVVFTSGSTGTLELGDSVAYAQGRIQGLSAVGANGLDLGDINFVSGTTTAAFSGTATSGVLTVTDGTHTAKINLIGDYLSSTFTTSLGAGGVGTRIIDTRPIAWTHQVSGAFATAADWTGGVAPGSANDAILDAPGSTAYI
ncbi:MAG TPA: hypothetical protein VFC47_10315, partial [Caulobacteraceae bacterium]|nr:hypothetical protein [Caulobacteraceae bacterium]